MTGIEMSVTKQHTTKYAITVTLILSILIAALVAGLIVLLRPHEVAIEDAEFKRDLLIIAGIYDANKTIEEQFKKVTIKLVDLDAGRFTDKFENVETFDQLASSKNPELSDPVAAEDDIAKLIRREKYAKVFLVNDKNGLSKVILPVRGYGLESIMSGFIALDKDLNTVVGFGFYEQFETPGLGGEVDSSAWKALWIGKKIYSATGEVKIDVIKGHVDNHAVDAEYKVDGLAGATLTSNGVRNLLRFWMGDKGFKPFLANLKNGDV